MFQIKFLCVLIGVQLLGLFKKSWLLEVLWTPPPKKKSLPSIWQSRNVKCKARAQNVMVLDCQIGGIDFLGGLKHFQELFGGQFKTWWGQHYDFSKWPKKLLPIRPQLYGTNSNISIVPMIFNFSNIQGLQDVPEKFNQLNSRGKFLGDQSV